MATEKADWLLPDKVRAAWQRLVRSYCCDEVLIDKCWKELEAKYTSSRRHYHNLQHIAALLQWSERFANELHNRAVVDLAIFYHDIIYNVLRKDNEPRSARIAAQRLQLLHVPAAITAQVKLFIEATQTHTLTDAVTHTTDLQLFLDFDMSILGADWPQYAAYTQQVRREYGIYPDVVYYPGRKQFLTHSLKSAHIFQTEAFRTLYEAKARENLGREMGLMG